jgi:MFS transporter, ACS family, allantoate permease
MSTASVDFKMGTDVDEKVVLDVSNGVVQNTIAEDTVEAAHQYSAAEFRRVRIKTDLVLMPLLWILGGLLTADKGAIGSQATFGIQKDTHLVGQQFAWLSTIFYLAYLFFEGPANYFMQRTHLGRTVGAFAICWGICVLSIAFCKDFTQLATVRFLQGAFECSIQPAFLLITGSFYPTRELPLRVIIWGTGSTSFGVISDLSLYGIGRAATKSGAIAPWRG